MRILLIGEALPDSTLTDLLAHRGHTVQAHVTGEAGLAAATALAFDLIILEVALPGIDGFEVCLRLRQAGTRVPILILTTHCETVDKVTGFECGADDYVTKPFDPDELLARIGALFRRSSVSVPNDLKTFEFDGKRIDFVRSQLISNEKTLELSERESRLLRHFVRHKGEIVTRETLLREVCGYQAMPDPRTVTIQISHLRHKLEDDPRNPRYILTVHGHGYRFSI